MYKAGALRPCRGQAKPRRGIRVSSRWGWGPSASEKMKTASPRVSFADVEQWPEDGRRYKLDDGEVYVVLHHFRCTRSSPPISISP